MDSSFQDLLKRLDHLSDQFRELKEGVHKAADIASRDPEMALTRARKVLELVVREVYERRCNEPAGTRPLENLIQRLVKDGHFPDRLDAYATTVRKLGNVGTHTFGEQITAQDVYQSLTQLMPILEWYFEVERPEAQGRTPEQRQPTDAAPVRSVASPAVTAAIAVVPKGLRSFDAQDADFFLDLLPGPRDKNGLPESIRFWKHRVEAADALTFTVGVIYGPSGCGKSSLVKAGLLPRLAAQVLPVYIESTGADTEARLLKGLRKRCTGLPGDLDLTGTMAALRQGRGLGEGQKVLVVLDQFEQWLHAAKRGEDAELAQALRQCDGERVQAVVLVRDDFWLAVSRFMGDLHIELLQGQNCALVDLFDPIHARNVLAAFGRAFGRLEQEPTKEQESFLDQAVQGLSQDGRVICVRLALFAEMVKGKPWTPAALKGVGGTEGVGVAFLEGTFSAAAAPAEHRYHQKAARAVLKALLPESGTDIKGHMRSYAELLEASGYANRPKDFDDLMRILDGEIRLITPTDPEGEEDAEVAAFARTRENPDAAVNPHSGECGYTRFYQLTHDYLVPSLRDWLTRKQKETPRGRAELLLADRAVVWNGRPENRQLPSLSQWFRIRWLTAKKQWTPPQRKMMGKAAHYHAVRVATLGVLLAVTTCTGLAIREQGIENQKEITEKQNETHATELVQRVLDAGTTQVPGVVAEMSDYRKWTDPLLRKEYDKAADKSRQKLHASLALLPVDPSQVDYLRDQLLLHAEAPEVGVIVQELRGHKDELIDRLWAVVEKPETDRDGRLRAAAALAAYDPDGPRWNAVAPSVVDGLVSVDPIFSDDWMKALRPVRDKLQVPLEAVFRDRKEDRANERNLATSILAYYAADKPDILADLLMDADVKQFAVIYPKFKEQSELALPVLTGEIDKKLPSDLPSSDEKREKLAKRQANAAVVMLRMNQSEKVWPLLKHSPDPRVRSYLIHRLGPLGADPRVVIRRFDEEGKVSSRRALLLSLGEFDPDQLSAADKEPMRLKVWSLYRDDPDPGLHGAAEWLLRQWEGERFKEMNEQWAKDQPQTETKLQQIKQELLKGQGKAKPQWYVNGQGQTLVVIPGPVQFQIGSPPTEASRDGGPAGKEEHQQEKEISRSFAIAARTVTVGQFHRFRKEFNYDKDYSPTDDCPVNNVSWYDAAAYCNWLSEQEGIAKDQWCYQPNEQGKFGEGMQLYPDYLHRTGYRLPSEAEWEYACRAGACTSRYYGEGEELLGRYAWYTKVSVDRGMLPGWPGKLEVRGDCLKPNDFGLFDMLGNAWEWCQDRMAPYKPGPDIEDKEGDTHIRDSDTRPLRGGCFYTQARYVRSAYRDRVVTSYIKSNNGFRVARTISP